MARKRRADPSRVVVYCRVSTSRQEEDGTSLEMQRERCLAYASLYGLGVVEVVTDAASGKTLDREGMARALAMLRSGEVGGLLCYKLDRLTRSVRDLAILLETHFGEGGARLACVTEQVDTSTAVGRLTLNLLTSVAQWERETIGERTRAAMGHRAEQRFYNGGHAPYGYRREGERLVEDPVEQAAIRRVAELRADCLSLRAIARVLGTEGHPARAPGGWSATQVARLLERAPSIVP